MRTVLLAFTLFKKRVFFNLVLVVELAAMGVVTLYLYNTASYSEMAIDIFTKGNSRIIYCMNPVQNGDYFAFRDSVYEKVKDNPWVEGVSDIGMSFMYFDRVFFDDMESSPMDEDYSEIILLNEHATKGLYTPIASGESLASKDVRHDEGYIPCVIGGMYQNRYKVGDEIRGYAAVAVDPDSDVLPANVEMSDGGTLMAEVLFKVVGKVKKPEIYLRTDTQMAFSFEFPLSLLFSSYSEKALYAIVSTASYPYVSMSNLNTYVYLDKDCPEEEVDYIKQSIDPTYARTDTELVAAEKKEIAQMYAAIKPYLVILLLVSISGVLALCMLNTYNNIKKFSIYFLVGCSRLRVYLITFAYALLFMVPSGILFLCTSFYLSRHEGVNQNFYAHYFDLSQSGVVMVMGVCIMLSVASFLMGFFVLRKKNVMEALTMK